MKFEWKPEYSVNIEKLDGQHKDFIIIMNKLYDSISGKKEGAILQDIFAELVAYAKFHFQTEETYFDEFGYPGTLEHKKAHLEFFEKVAALKEKSADHEIEISFELIDFLEDWLLNHLADVDQKYSSFLNEKGLV